MTKSYSLDLRQRVARFVEAGHSRRAAARHFEVSVAFVTGMSCVGSRVVSSHRDRGTRSTEGGQVDRTMGCEPELVADRPCDPPGCAASADP